MMSTIMHVLRYENVGKLMNSIRNVRYLYFSRDTLEVSVFVLFSISWSW